MTNDYIRRVENMRKRKEDHPAIAQALQDKGHTVREIAQILGYKHPGSMSHLLNKKICTMQNNLPESIMKKIQDEAEAKFRHAPSADKRSWAKSGYTAAAEAILSNPGEYGLAGVVSESRRKHLREQAHTALELLKGYTPEQRKNWGNGLKTVEEFAGYIMELTNESGTPSDRVQQLEQALKEILEENVVENHTIYISAVRKIASNALKQNQ